MAVVGAGEVLISPSFKGLQKEVGKEIAGIPNNSSVKGSGSKLGNFIKTGLKIGAGAGVAAVGVALTKGFGRLQAIENAKAKLSGLGHSAQGVEKIMTNATTAVKGTAFGLGEAATVAANAVAAGVKPGADLERTLKLVADASTIAGTDMASMGAIFNKAAASNKVQMDVINQLHDAGVPALQLIANELGVTAEEASKMASKGEVDFATFQNAMEKGMGGAAQESGKTLKGAFDNSMAAIGRFGANLMSDIYPQIRDFFAGFIEFMGPVEELGKVIGEKLGEALRQFTGWITENKDAILAFLPVIGIAVAGLGAYFAITKTMAGFKAIQTWYAATTFAQKGLNGAMKANPIGVIITAITALVAALVWLYNNNETARRIMDAAWQGIKNAIQFAWNNVIKPAFNAISNFVKNVLGPVFTWLYQNVVKPVWQWIREAISNHWNNIKIVFQAIQWFINNVLGPVFKWLYNNIVKPVFSGIGQVIKLAWDGVVKPVFNAIRGFLQNTLGPVFKWLYDKVIKPVWEAIKTVIKTVWDNGIRPVFTAIMQLLKGDFKAAFQTAKDAIDRIWRGVANVVRKPINFVIGTVYNDGIRKVFNKVAGIVGIKQLDPANTVPAFAKGGFHKGGWALVGEEGPELVNFSDPGRVYTAAETQAMLAGKQQAPLGAIDSLRENGFGQADHAGIGGFWSNPWESIKGAARSVGSAVKKGLDWVRGGLAKAAEWVLNPLKNGLSKTLGTQGFGGMAAGLAKKAIDGAISWLRGKDDEWESAGGEFGGGFTGANGGFYRPVGGTITSMFGSSRGRYPHAGTDLAVPIGTAVKAAWNGVVKKAGWNIVTGRSGIGMLLAHSGGKNTYYGHLSKTVAKPGQEVKAGQTIARSGNTGRSTGPHLHFETWQNGKPYNNIGLLRGGGGGKKASLYDNGGVLPPGLTAALNLSKKPEAILTHRQWQAISQLAARGATGIPSTMTLVVDGREFTAYVSDVAYDRMMSAKRQSRQMNRQLSGNN